MPRKTNCTRSRGRRPLVRREATFDNAPLATTALRHKRAKSACVLILDSTGNMHFRDPSMQPAAAIPASISPIGLLLLWVGTVGSGELYQSF